MWVEMGVVMARELNRLSSRTIATKTKSGYYPDGGGLYLQISATGSKSWIFRYTLNGKSREMGLGSLLVVNPTEARQKASEARAHLLGKVDPIEARNSAQNRLAADQARQMTFTECAEAYIKGHASKWKNEKHKSQWENTLETYCGPVFGNLPVNKVDTGLVAKVLDPIWSTKHETATRVRSRIENVLAWATVRGYRDGDNPARWRGHLKQLLPVIKKAQRVKHHAALHYGDLSSFMTDLKKQVGIAARALEFTILTAARTNEVIAATPDEFDLTKGLWTIPAQRMKAQKEHRVPLSPRAVEIIKEMLKIKGSYVFQGLNEKTHLSNMAMLSLLKRMEKTFTVHGFRSTFRDWSAECTSYPREVCESALAHTVSDKVEAAYRRGDLFEKRRKLMNDWAKFCNSPKASGNVVALRGKSPERLNKNA